MSKVLEVQTGRRDVRMAQDGTGVRSAAADIFKNNRSIARQLAAESTLLGAELRRLFDRERSLRSTP